MFRKLALALILVPLFEIMLLITLTKAIGWVTLAIVIVTGVAGAFLLKSQGLRTLLAFRMGKASPVNAATDGVMIVIAGVLLLTPGVFTDILGFMLLTPSVRDRLRSSVKMQAMSSMNFPSQNSAEPAATEKPRSATRPTVIDV